jgi:hypothetical protein
MIVLLVLTLIIAIPVLAGFSSSWRQRRADRQHSAAFVGFSAGVAAVIATLAYFTSAIVWLRPPELPYFHPVAQGFVFISGWIGLVASLVAFVAGLFSSGSQRITLIIFGPVIGLIYVLAAFSNFGG